jgi:hypothetical protein
MAGETAAVMNAMALIAIECRIGISVLLVHERRWLDRARAAIAL